MPKILSNEEYKQLKWRLVSAEQGQDYYSCRVNELDAQNKAQAGQILTLEGQLKQHKENATRDRTALQERISAAERDVNAMKLSIRRARDDARNAKERAKRFKRKYDNLVLEIDQQEALESVVNG